MRPILSRQRSDVSGSDFNSLCLLMWHSTVVSEQLVRLKLAQEAEEEEQELDAGLEGSSIDDHPSVVILNGLRLEDDQCIYFSLCL